MTDEVRNRLLDLLHATLDEGPRPLEDKDLIAGMLRRDPALSDAIGLGLAWAECEAALPPGGRLHIQRRAEAQAQVQDDGSVWIARQGRAAGAYEAWATDNAKTLGFAYADTPTAALQKLTAHLRAALSDPTQEKP